jgi:hypothetical protein
VWSTTTNDQTTNRRPTTSDQPTASDQWSSTSHSPPTVCAIAISADRNTSHRRNCGTRLRGGAWLAHKVVPPWAFSPTLLLNFVLLVAVGGAIFCHAISKPKRP